MNILENKILNKIESSLSKFNKKLLALILFGSYVRSFKKAKDIDLLVIVDKIENIYEKFEIEKEISIQLIKELKLPFEINVLDLDNFFENLKPGTFISGLVLGYKIIYDKIGIEYYIKKLCQELANEIEYEFIKHGKRYRLGIFAKVLLNRKFR